MQPVLLHGVAANRLAQLLAGDVPLLFVFGVVGQRSAQAELVLRVAQRLEYEKIRVAMITSVAAQQFRQWMIWIYHTPIFNAGRDLGN